MFEKTISHIEYGAFLTGCKRFRLLSPYNKGWVVENAKNRLPFELSARGVLLVSSTGGGKSTTMTAVNLLRLTENPCSICCLDPSGDMMRLVAPALRMKGVDVQVFQPANPTESMKFNKLSDIDPVDRTYIREVAKIIIRSAYPQSSSDNQFWEDGGVQVIAILIEGICTQLSHERRTLETLYYYLNVFNSRRDEVNQLMMNLPETSYTEFLGIVSAEPKMLNSFLSTCKVALQLMGSQDVREVTSETSFDISDMRRRSTCLFLVVEEFQLKTFAFLTTLLMHSVMKCLMQHKSPELSPYLHQFLIWDEFANAMTYNEMIPSFLSTCRK